MPFGYPHIALLAVFVPIAVLAGTDTRPLTSTDGLIAHGVTVQAVRYENFDSVRIEVRRDHRRGAEGGCGGCTFARVAGIEFGNGSIAIEVAGRAVENAPPWARGFVGIVFRASENGERFEGVYLRPVNATSADPEQRSHTVQYFSYPEYPWHRLREESPGRYESYANVRTGEWTHLEIRVADSQARLYVNGSDEPVLSVDDLKLGPDARGAIGLYTEPATEAYFRNLVVTD